MKIVDSRKRLQLQQPKEFSDALMRIERALPAEMDQQRSIASSLESRSIAQRGAFAVIRFDSRTFLSPRPPCFVEVLIVQGICVALPVSVGTARLRSWNSPES